MKLTNSHKYDDIIHLARPESGRRARMTNYDRAAQFSPFAALTGFDAAIEEAGRLTDSRGELDEGAKQILDEQMQKILERIGEEPRVTVRWFRYDERKAGGAYVTTTGNVKKVDLYREKILLTDGQLIPMGEIFSITLEDK